MNIKTNSCHIALDIVVGLKIITAVCTAKVAAGRITTVNLRAAAGIAVLLIATGAVDSGIGGTNVVQVCAAAGRGITTEGLWPYMLSVPAVPLIHGCGVHGVD